MYKGICTFVLTAFICSSVSIVPSQSATIKNGVKCSKVNSTTKVGSKIYRCGKNPYFKPKSLTWTLRGCFTAQSLLREARSQYEDWKDLAKIAGPDGEKTLTELQTSISELEITMKEQVCKKGA
jgi:hypothetical protein